MRTRKIFNYEIEDKKIASLPSRPTAPTSFGGRGYTAREMKEAFDKLPLFIIERFNTLIDDICALGDTSLASAIPTGITDNHTLKNFFDDVKNGNLANRLNVGNETVLAFANRISALTSNNTTEIGLNKLNISRNASKITQHTTEIEKNAQDVSEVNETLATLRAEAEALHGEIEALKNAPSGPRIVTNAPSRFTLEHNTIYRFGEQDSFNITLPTNARNDFRAEVSFDSPADPTVIFFTGSKCLMTGENIFDNGNSNGYSYAGLPQYHYNLFFWYDGRMHCHGRGIHTY